MVMRRNLLSEIPRSTPGHSSEGTHSEGSYSRGGGADGSDADEFGRWLTRGLRPKGSNEPPSRERVRLAASVVVAEPESDFARWLRTDLRPRNSSLPPSEFAAVEAIIPAARAGVPGLDSMLPATDSLVPASGSMAPTADSFGPQTIEEPLAADLARLPAETVLQEEDLAVLPSRRRTGARRWPALALLLGLLCFVGGVALWGGRGQPSAPAAAVVPAPMAAAEPAPAAPEAAEPPAPAARAPQNHRATKPASAEPQLPTALARTRTGSSVGRFADLPLPTLSRLAKDEKQQTNDRDAKARAAGKANRKSTPVLP